MREEMMRVAYALRKEGVEIIRSADGRFPRFLIKKPSKNLLRKAVEITECRNGVRAKRFAARVENCTVYWA